MAKFKKGEGNKPFKRNRSLAELANETQFRSSKDKAKRTTEVDVKNETDKLAHPLVSYERRLPWEVELGRLNVEEKEREAEKKPKSRFKRGDDGGAIFIFE